MVAAENGLLYDHFGIANADDWDLVRSIRKSGIQEPLTISHDQYLLSGHRRLAAAKYLRLPYRPMAISRKASATDPSTWGTFAQAKAAFEQGGQFGVGFVLSVEEDGIVGVDLDNCVQADGPEPAAMGLLERVGCQYIELSPSGTGLRGFGYGEDIKGTRGQIDGIHAELYARGRYLTVTGHAIKQGPLVALPGFLEVAIAIRGDDLQKRQREQNQSSVSSASSVVSGLPISAVPTKPGMRNRCLSELARHLKGTQPDMTRSEQRVVGKYSVLPYNQKLGR